MEISFAEMPLALFTTLASMGAGAFIALAVALFTVRFSEEQLRALDRFNLVPLILVLVGFVAAFFHLASPLHAVGVFAGTGSSPLSNEIVMGGVFTVVAIVYVALGLAGKLSAGARKGLAVATALLAVLFALFMGFAYMMDTIISWNSPLVPLQMLGFALVGGTSVAALVLALAKTEVAVGDSAFKNTGLVLAVIGVALGIGCLLAQANGVAAMENPLVSGAVLAGNVTGLISAAAVLLVAACVACGFSLRGKGAVGLGGLATVLAFAGILCGRLAFYGLELSVGLCF